MNVLVVAPHADDEVIGCGGLIAKRIAQGNEVMVVVVGLGGMPLTTDCHPVANLLTDQDDVRLAEMRMAAKVLGTTDTQVIYLLKEMRLDSIPLIDLVTQLDAVVNEHPYKEIFIPLPSVNHDHRIVYQAMLSALRTSVVRPHIRSICAYEYALSGWPQPTESAGSFYVDITRYLELKLEALSHYESQKRPFPHPCHPDSVKALALFRGMESGVRAAELFHVLRTVERD